MSDSEHIREQILEEADGIDSVWGPAKRSIAELTEQNAQRVDSAADAIAAALQEIIGIMVDQTRMAATNNAYAGDYFKRTLDRMGASLENTNNPIALSALAHLDAAHHATRGIGHDIDLAHGVALYQLEATGQELLSFLSRLGKHLFALPFIDIKDLEQAERNGAMPDQLAASDCFYAKVEHPISQATDDLRRYAQEL